MLNSISLWIKQIVVVVIFTAFIDILIPEDNFLKYIKVFLGLIVITVIVNPLVPFIQEGVLLNLVVPQGCDGLKNNSLKKHDIQVFNETNNELTINEYKSRIENYILQKLANETSFCVKKVTVQIHEDFDHEDFGKITQLLIIMNNNEKLETGKISIDTIKTNIEGKIHRLDNQNKNNEFEDIVEYLQITFGIPRENILVSSEG